MRQASHTPDPASLLLVLVINLVIWIPTIWSLVGILRRMGFSAWWLSMIGLWPIGLWMLAYNRWPAVDRVAT